MSLELVPLGTMVIDLADPLVIPNTPAGTRVIVGVNHLRVEGDRLRGQLKGTAAADWLTISPDGTGTLDVRALIETHDGAMVYLYYQGRRDFSQGLDAPTYAAPKFDTGDDRYLWLNKIQAAAKGTVDGTVLTYEVYELR